MEFHPESVLDSILLDAPHEQLWSLSDPKVLWFFAEKAKTSGLDGYELFFRHVIECIEKRMALVRSSAFNPAENGRWLCFYPCYSLFEDVAIDETDGFYGSGDCPPPAFWTQVCDDALVSFIPQKYVALANIGVEISVAENLEWTEAPLS